ncbi:MAG: hypothetical protein NVS9B2_30520 [Steroidobacteraceae bacterium]
MRKSSLFLLISAAFVAPAFAAGGHGGGGGFGGHAMGASVSHGMSLHAASTHTHPANHGALVSQTAHQAHASGMKVGPQVRTVARSKSQGPTHANSHALAAVNGTHGNAGSNSVLGTSTGTSTRHGKGNR